MFWLLSSIRPVITNDQGLTELSLLHISNTFLNILAVPNNAVFCITPTLDVIPSFSIHLSNPLVTLPRPPITTETISTFLSFHNLPISLFSSWYFFTFLFPSSLLLHQPVQQYLWLSIAIMSCLLASITLSHWTLISFTSSFSTNPSGTCSYHFSICSNPFFLQISQWNFFATLSCYLLYSFWANFSHSHSKCCTLSPLFPQNLHRGLSLVLSM